ncbi:MAG: hypothetical protein GTN74_08340 [Proteobacteria bacterium]|nr:hypothetical protein [Pseudomonadota bacterium]NIS69834.1 hypothetical protein [Pseudomonadota bacterium]
MAGPPFQPKSLVADSSSLIYLAKSSIIRPFLQAFDVTIPPLVLRECVQDGYPGSNEIERLRKEGRLSVHPTGESVRALTILRGGEREVITLFYELRPDGILIDDGAGVKACRRRGIPFISALLIPSLLLLKKAIGVKEAEESLERVVEVGRYSQRVVFVARIVLSEACGLQTQS